MVDGARRRRGGKICACKTTSFYVDSPAQVDHRLANKTNINRYPKTCRIMALGCYFPRHGDLFFPWFYCGAGVVFTILARAPAPGEGAIHFENLDPLGYLVRAAINRWFVKT